MNNTREQGLFQQFATLAGLAAALALATPAARAAQASYRGPRGAKAPSSTGTAPKTATAAPRPAANRAIPIGSGEFFIISSVNPRKGEMVLKMPTEVTLTMGVDSKTEILDEQGQRLGIGDLVSGDTAYITYKRTSQGTLAEKIQLAPMTVEELHRRYLNGESVAVPRPALPPAKTSPPTSTPHPRGAKLQRGA